MDGRIKNCLFFVAFMLTVPQWVAAESLWTDIPDSIVQARGVEAAPSLFKNVRRLTVDSVSLKSTLDKAPMESGQIPDTQIQLPMPDGRLSDFYIVESPVMEPGLAGKYPQIKTYKVRSVDDDFITGRLDLGPNGFHAYLNTSDGVVYIDPEPASNDAYNSFYKPCFESIHNIIFSNIDQLIAVR